MAISTEDRHLTTFITPWGRYRHKTAPQGYIASGDGYTQRYDEIVSDIPNKTKCVDDTLLWADSLEESFFQTVQWLDICGRHRIILNPEKFTFDQDSVEFAAFEITLDSVRPCPKYLQAILDFPRPNNITDVRSWFGLINQVSYAFSMAHRMLPFRELLKPGTAFKWDEELQPIFEESKAIIISEIMKGVQIFDPKKPTCLATDWSKTGIGFWLLQKHCKFHKLEPFCCHDGWNFTFTHDAESRYAPVEREALAVADALNKARYFILGCEDLIIAIDHKPLLKIFSNRSLEDISNCRLRYRFRMVHMPGIKHHAADCVSRHPAGDAEKLSLPDDTESTATCGRLQTVGSCSSTGSQDSIEETILSSSMSSLKYLATKSITWDSVRSATTSDKDMHTLHELITAGLAISTQPPYVNTTSFTMIYTQ